VGVLVQEGTRISIVRIRTRSVSNTTHCRKSCDMTVPGGVHKIVRECRVFTVEYSKKEQA